jgi:hypothetical protein
MALQRMTRRLAEASQGTGEAVKAIAELGLSAEDLGKLAPDEQFRMIADAMSKIPSQADRVRLSFKLFDSEGVALVNTLALGSKGIDEMRDRLAALGGTFSEVEANQVARANDALAEIGELVRGLGNRLAITLAPAIEGVANKLTEFVIASGGMTAVVVPAFESLLALTDRFIQFGNVIRGVFNVIQGVGGV